MSTTYDCKGGTAKMSTETQPLQRYSLSGATSAQGGTVVTQLGPLVRTAMSENCAVNVAPVPTLGEWAMMLLASLMAAFGWVMMRRRMG